LQERGDNRKKSREILAPSQEKKNKFLRKEGHGNEKKGFLNGVE